MESDKREEASKLLEVEAVTKGFGGIQAVKNVSLSLQKNRIYGLIGPNGSGKTTLFNLITGYLRYDSGNVIFRGRSLKKMDPFKIARMGIGRTFQGVRVFPRMTVARNLMAAASHWGEEEKKRAEEMLTMVGLTRLRDEEARNLSFAQQKWLEFARMMITNPELLLLDEPAAGLDSNSIEKMVGYISATKQNGKTICVVEHNMNVVMKTCEYIYVLDHGEKIAEGTADVVKKDEKVITAYLGESRAQAFARRSGK